MKVSIFQTEAHGDEYKIQKEHGETEALVHFPPEASDANDDEQKHRK